MTVNQLIALLSIHRTGKVEPCIGTTDSDIRYLLERRFIKDCGGKEEWMTTPDGSDLISLLKTVATHYEA